MNRFIVAISIALLAGCYEVEYSQTLTESAIVDDVIFAPSQHGSGISPGISASGNMTMSFTSVDIPKKYAIVFKCAHGKFVVEGTSDRHKKLWQSLSRGEAVTVSYREIYRVNDGQRTLHGYDFLDAQPET